ncbi:LANO_0G13256g1_1 [Lachancea nothofagi CBS 11611]|uniref:LANO_0G13256g1_1 n=1 Tax=Lachancea nothofagi CBS 11611 TaxID=1266666 RepID=A0A1G4KK36_9SACH|nr:LANO_0G13256g1_1 [Lachancea nothofagi CBS 11611]
MRPKSLFNKMKSPLLAFATLACLWFSILIILFSLVLLHLPSVSCTSIGGPRFCVPQYKIQFLEVPDGDQDLLLGAKDLLTLLSYVAVDLNSKIRPAVPTDYDDVNLVNTFNPSNTFKINHLGYCKEQPGVKKIPSYCSDNGNGLELISMLVRDVGVQFGITSSKNPRIMGDSFVYAFKLGLRTLVESRRGNPKSGSAFSKYIPSESSSPPLEGDPESFSRWSGVAGFLLLMQKFCWSMSLINLVEFSMCILVIVSTIIMAPAALTGRKSSNWHMVDEFGCLVLKIIPMLTVIVSFLGVFSSSLFHATLIKSSATYGLSHRYYELQIGSGFYLSIVRLILECVLLWQILKFNKHIKKVEHTSGLSPAVVENWHKDLETDSVLSSGITV